MAQRKITSGGIADNAIGSDKLSFDVYTQSEVDNAIANNQAVTSSGTQPSNPSLGDLWYDTSGNAGILKIWDGNSFADVSPVPPTVISIDVSEINEGDGTQTIVITGTDFDGAASGLLLGNNGTDYVPTTSTRNSDSQITLVYSGGDVITDAAAEPLDVKVTNGNGLTAVLTDALTINNSPAWSTSVGNLGTVYEDASGSSFTVAATDPEGGSITYSISSGALPSGMSLNTSSGVIDGTPNVNDSYNSAGVTHNFSIDASDGTNTTNRSFNILRKWYDGSSSSLAVANAQALVDIGVTGTGLYWIDVPTIGAMQVYCDLSTDYGGWMHCGTISDNNENAGYTNTMTQQSAVGQAHPWGAPLYAPQDTDIWQDNSTFGSQSFTADFKSHVWSKMPMQDLLIKDQGNSLRNILHTNSGAMGSHNSFSAFWAARSWAAGGSDLSNNAYSGGRVFGASITNYGVADPALNASNKSILLFKFGEYDGTQDSNKDRTMITSHRHDAGDNVDAPSGLGCFRSSATHQVWRDVVPHAQQQDEPPTNITGAPYNYTLWVR